MERPLAYRILRRGLRAASRAAGEAVDRAIQRRGQGADDVPTLGRAQGRAPRAGRAVPVRFELADGTAVVGEVERGCTVLEAARQLDVELSHYCGGNCSCGTCRVQLRGAPRSVSKAEPLERAVLGAGARPDERLACQTRIQDDVVIAVSDWF